MRSALGQPPEVHAGGYHNLARVICGPAGTYQVPRDDGLPGAGATSEAKEGGLPGGAHSR